ncbi:MAG TPA: hypothetical protein VMM17_06585 [Gemmatimonadaceae bacterium]|nr:hypothetical protein [Gemmatimonadaceae bacterium]
MRSPLHLLCFASLAVGLLACRSRDPAGDRAIADSLPPVAPEVEPVPDVASNPAVSVPRPNVSPAAISAPPPRAAAPQPETPDDSATVPSPPMDIRPSIPIDTLRLDTVP